MKKQKVLIIGNKQYHNFQLNDILDKFDIIYRCNLAFVGKNNGTKFGKLAMCGHIYHHFVKHSTDKEEIMKIYSEEYDATYLSDWYDFFQTNKENFDEIFHQDENNWGEWNRMLEKYGSPHKFSKMASTGYSTIFKNLSNDNNEVYISGFTLCDGEIRKTEGESAERTIQANNNGGGCHSFSDETKILNWLHKNKKIDASLCMLDDTKEVSIKTNDDSMKLSEFISELITKR
jgi:hypothetical protein